MPTLQRFATCRIAIYADDHNPPHFHVEGKGWRARVAIENFAILAGRIDDGGIALDWARNNIAFLRAEWDRLNTLRG